jgi:hypothetical protein
MKKTVLFVTAILISASSLFAQSSGGAAANGVEKNFHFGLNITPGLYFASPGTSSAGITNTANSAAFGFGYGVNLEFYFTPNYGIATGIQIQQFGVNYTSVNSVSKNPFNDSTTAHTQSMQYLQIPLLLKLRTNSIGLIKYFGEFGLGADFLLSAKDNPTVTNAAFPNDPVTYSSESIYKQSDFIRLSLLVGLGVEYNLAGSTSIQGALIYDNAFTNLNSSSDNSVLVKGINLTIGVLF